VPAPIPSSSLAAAIGHGWRRRRDPLRPLVHDLGRGWRLRAGRGMDPSITRSGYGRDAAESGCGATNLLADRHRRDAVIGWCLGASREFLNASLRFLPLPKPVMATSRSFLNA
jgi:hypothetical protein